MTGLHQVHDRINQEGRLGPSARLGATRSPHLAGPGASSSRWSVCRDQGTVAGLTSWIAPPKKRHRACRDLRRANPTAVYEIRPVPSIFRVPFRDGGCDRCTPTEKRRLT